MPEYFLVEIGSLSPEFAGNLLLELIQRGVVSGRELRTMNQPPTAISVSLTLDGWKFWEAERIGHVVGKFGFIAMKFNDPVLDLPIKDNIKPIIKEQTGYEIFDLRDVSRAGVIDNIMRAQIRDSAFVLVDLTHDNSGAYWEAGYAEGLGKPVIYICERDKFDRAKTHFDTNHCTTVIWSAQDIEGFMRELVATLRRSLNLFPNS